MSVNGYTYFVTIVEEYTRYSVAMPINSKGAASDALLKFTVWFERQTGETVKRFHTDGRKAFNRAESELLAKGVEVTRITLYTPQSNGLAERTHQTILGLARSCLSESGLPERYWDYAVGHVADCRNLLPHRTTRKVPYTAIFSRSSKEITSDHLGV